MATRDIIQIDEDLCNGCGDCISSCAEGALELVDGKAKLVSDIYCDGLGACLSECPTGALKVIQRESEDFDEEAVKERVQSISHSHSEQKKVGACCPGSMPQKIAPMAAGFQGCPGSAQRSFAPATSRAPVPGDPVPSALTHWPIQLHLASPMAPFFKEADLLLAADCTAFAHGDFHRRFLEGHSLQIACPKLDNPSGYIEKLKYLFANANLKSFTVAIMVVPCCNGLLQMVKQAREEAKSELPIKAVIVDLSGEVVSEEML
ncbi:ATP-binding protein [Candidatus Riflebacteria bacterium]